MQASIRKANSPSQPQFVDDQQENSGRLTLHSFVEDDPTEVKKHQINQHNKHQLLETDSPEHRKGVKRLVDVRPLHGPSKNGLGSAYGAPDQSCINNIGSALNGLQRSMEED